MSDEYDAFGRKKDEAGLGDLGWGATGDRPTSAAPEATPTTPVATTRPQTELQTVTPRTSGLGRPRRNPFVFFIQFVVLAGVAAAIYFAVIAGNDAADSARKTIDAFTQGSKSGSGSSEDRGDDTVPKQV